MTSAAAATPVSRPATIESRGHMLARRVPVPTVGGASGGPHATMPVPMAGPTEQLRTRVLPALLTAFGVTILSAGLLTYTVPVAGRCRRRRRRATPEPSEAVVPTPTPLITLPPIGTATPSRPGRARHPPDATARRPRCDPGPDPGPRHRPRGRPGNNGYPVLQRRDVPAPALTAGLRQGDLPLCPRPRRHVPAAPGDRGFDQRGMIGRGLDQRRLALQVRDHAGPARSAVHDRSERSGRREERAALASDLAGARPPVRLHAGHREADRRPSAGQITPTATPEGTHPSPAARHASAARGARSSRCGGGRRPPRPPCDDVSAVRCPEPAASPPATRARLAHPEDARHARRCRRGSRSRRSIAS